MDEIILEEVRLGSMQRYKRDDLISAANECEKESILRAFIENNRIYFRANTNVSQDSSLSELKEQALSLISNRCSEATRQFEKEKAESIG